MMEQDYVSTNYSDGIGNRIHVKYDVLLTDNYLETASNYSYYMTLGASLGSSVQVIHEFFLESFVNTSV
jgi:hypothetical protein